jgi:hypothetical protein
LVGKVHAKKHDRHVIRFVVSEKLKAQGCNEKAINNVDTLHTNGEINVPS